ncbi:hypothetical protein B4133_3426 [Bacillus altitudinis]|nr:hypothetical protein B4133_3426 [Bacillus altitudinis]PYH27780.1 hypothetical protein US8_00403 [Bacillus altitudinis]
MIFSQEEPLAVNHLRRIGIIHVWSTRFACFFVFSFDEYKAIYSS